MSGCEEVRGILVAEARGESVSAAGARFLREHVEACPGCSRRLANERMLSAGLAAMASATAGVPPASVKAAVLSEFRRQQRVVPIGRPARRTAMWIGIAAVAAALLLAFLAPRGRRPERVAPPVNVPVAVVVAPRVVPPGVVPPGVLPRVVTPRVVAPPVAPSADSGRHRVASKVSGRPKGHPTASAAVEDAPEVATDFFEIPYVEPLRPDQRADVFRVQMPRAGMAVFGLPVVGGRLDSRVTADVLMGEDGVVRAVRFIR